MRQKRALAASAAGGSKHKMWGWVGAVICCMGQSRAALKPAWPRPTHGKYRSKQWPSLEEPVGHSARDRCPGSCAAWLLCNSEQTWESWFGSAGWEHRGWERRVLFRCCSAAVWVLRFVKVPEQTGTWSWERRHEFGEQRWELKKRPKGLGKDDGQWGEGGSEVSVP